MTSLGLEVGLVSVSLETANQTDARLRQVIRSADFKVYDQPYAFVEYAILPDAIAPDTLALVRDDDVWSQLAPKTVCDQEAFAIFRFHFPPELDNSGFVGWLASHLKRRFGTGLFVVCGHNSNRGGIFDYWGCPWELKDEVITEIRAMRSGV